MEATKKHRGGTVFSREAVDQEIAARPLTESKLVAEIVEGNLLVGAIGDVASIGRTALTRRLPVFNDADSEAESFVYRAELFGIASREIVVDGEDVRRDPREHGRSRG